MLLLLLFTHVETAKRLHIIGAALMLDLLLIVIIMQVTKRIQQI